MRELTGILGFILLSTLGLLCVVSVFEFKPKREKWIIEISSIIITICGVWLVVLFIQNV